MIKLIKELKQGLNMTNIINKISNWQDTRTPWIIMVIISAGLVVTSHSFFQNYLYMRPCEQCVYIRFAFLCMTLGGTLAGISPKNIILKLIAYALSFWGAILGIMYSLKLDKRVVMTLLAYKAA